MMEYTRNKLETLIGRAQSAYRQWYSGEIQRPTLDLVEMDLYAYVEGLLAEKNADIKRLEARQITGEMQSLWNEYDAQVQQRVQLTVTDFMAEQSGREFKLWRAFCNMMRQHTPDAP